MYGEKTFNISSRYIQTKEQATRLMHWISQYVGGARKQVSMDIFPMSHIEVGDKAFLVDSMYEGSEWQDLAKTCYVITSVSYNLAENGPRMNVTMSEIVPNNLWSDSFVHEL